MLLKAEGFNVNSIKPQAAIYLSVQIDLIGKIKPNNEVLATPINVWQYVLDEAQMAIVPFSSFGAPANSTWYRISVGTCKIELIPTIINNLRKAMLLLK